LSAASALTISADVDTPEVAPDEVAGRLHGVCSSAFTLNGSSGLISH